MSLEYADIDALCDLIIDVTLAELRAESQAADARLSAPRSGSTSSQGGHPHLRKCDKPVEFPLDAGEP